MRRRLAVWFALQLGLAGAVLVVLAAAVTIWMLGKFEEIEISRNFAPLGISRLLSEAEIDTQGLIVESKFVQKLKNDGGWLQSLDEKGNVLQSFQAPDDVPSSYVPGQLIDFWIGNEPFPYQLGLWMEEKDGRLFTLLYGTRSQAENLLMEIMKDGKVQNTNLSFSDDIVGRLQRLSGWIQVLDQEGAEIASWHKPEQAQHSYTLQELAMRASSPNHFGLVMDSEYD
ncbi:MAG: hypothetical protein H7X86_07045, partial [Gorillibacterium sp.]|nr:hypothetical protein [Gorillibacterium sp.]